MAVPPLIFGSNIFQSLESIRTKIDNTFQVQNITIEGTLTANKITDGIAYLQNGYLKNLNNPILPQDAANKQYVDSVLTVPAGSNTQIQFNNSGSFGASSNLTWISPSLNITGTLQSSITNILDSLSLSDIEIVSPVISSDFVLTLPPNPGSSGYIITTNGAGVLTFVTKNIAAGSANQIQYNNGSNGFASTINLTFDSATNTLTATPSTITTIVDSLNSYTDTLLLDSLITLQTAVTSDYTLIFPLTDGTSGQILNIDSTSGSEATLGWATPGSVGGANTEIQLNMNGAFDASPNLTYSLTNGLTIKDKITASLTNPEYISNLTMSASSGLFIYGNYAYVLISGTLNIVDITNPASPVTKGSYTNAILTSANSIYVTGLYAYISAGTNLVVINVSDVNNPLLESSLSFADTLYKIFIQGSYLYTLTYNISSTFYIINISDPSNLIITGSTTNVLFIIPSELFVYGSYAYISTTGSQDLVIVDISNPSGPSIIDSISLGTTSNTGLYVSNQYAYVTSGGNAVMIVDISNPSNPILVNTYTLSGTRKLTLSYPYLIVNYTNSIDILDISNPSNIFSVGSLTDSTNIGSCENIKISGSYIYLTNDTKFTVLDINGVKISSCYIGNLKVTSLNIKNNLQVSGDVATKGGLNANLILANNILFSKGSSSGVSVTINEYSGSIVFNTGIAISSNTVIDVTCNKVSSNSIILTSVVEYYSGFPVAEMGSLISATTFRIVVNNLHNSIAVSGNVTVVFLIL